MKIIKQFLSLLLIPVLCISFTGCKKSDNQSLKTDDTFNIVASFYPMHILLMNLTDGIDGVTESSMSDPNMGCIHDHTFTTEDLKKIEQADVYVENGLGLETFNDKIKETYPDTPIIEASKNITPDSNDDNAHVWTDINNYILQIQYVSSELQQLDAAHKNQYAANEKSYTDQLTQIKNDYADKVAAVSNKKVLLLEETLKSFCSFLNLDTMEIHTDHEQESLSAADLKDAIAKMKKENVKTILIAKNGNRQNAEIIAAETGAKIYEMNTCMTGTADKEAYLNDMKENFEIISEIN